MSDINTSLMLRYKLDEVSGTTATDSVSGGTKNGTWTSAPGYEAGKINGAATAAAGKALNAGSGFSVTGPKTFAAWIKTLAVDGPVVFGGGNFDPNLMIDAGSGDLNFNNVNDSVAGPTVADGAWHHVCVTDDMTTATLYSDGVAFGTVASDQEDWDSSAFFIGSVVTAISGDDILIYSRALSAADVAALAASLTGPGASGTAPGISRHVIGSVGLGVFGN